MGLGKGWIPYQMQETLALQCFGRDWMGLDISFYIIENKRRYKGRGRIICKEVEPKPVRPHPRPDSCPWNKANLHFGGHPQPIQPIQLWLTSHGPAPPQPFA